MNSKYEDSDKFKNDWYCDDNIVSKEIKEEQTNKTDKEDDFFTFNPKVSIIKENSFRLKEILFDKEEDIDQCSKDFFNFVYK